ncbi:hypothetical protein K469DRAFT_682799 [Zopfia rhizophila CBS 207.26]|uniref:Uncharacterized protein n=1 Tax=Zopfia rhizophila CBS 207.26 TaxID=1314779 RepID=A0A6A6DA69_9PEZI|nr:hypothetical protein K469DRAFT_682799 [Zopfia rhizophila CBS 207.26]
MHLSNSIIVCSLLSSFASACYNDGPKNFNRQLAYDNLPTVAKYLQGNYEKYQTRGTCVTDKPNGSSWYFSIRRSKDTGGTITKESVEKILKMQVQVCKWGGKQNYGDWEAKSDPNRGVCQDVGYINEQNPSGVPVAPGRAMKRDDGVVSSFDVPNLIDTQRATTKRDDGVVITFDVPDTGSHE